MYMEERMSKYRSIKTTENENRGRLRMYVVCKYTNDEESFNQADADDDKR